MAKEYDPRMHSAEHILNQTMVRMFNRGRAFSAHVEKKKSKCDYHFDRDLTPGEREELERRVNDVIAPSKVQVLVDEAGNGASVVVLESSGLPEADQRALRLARNLRFAPAPALTFGEITFRWHTLPAASTNAP